MIRIEFSGCGKSFNRKWLFKNLNLTLNQGEKWAVLGANGSGKSTLTLMIAGQVWPTEGQITRVQNNQVLKAEHVHQSISLASPAMEIPGEFSLKELLALHRIAKPLIRNTDVETIAALCNFDSKTIVKPLYHFSSGMLQRVKLALAVFSDTPILILDEPLSNLDKAGFALYNHLIENYTDNRLLVIASNRPDEYGFCDRSLEIKPEGSVVVNEQFT